MVDQIVQDVGPGGGERGQGRNQGKLLDLLFPTGSGGQPVQVVLEQGKFCGREAGTAGQRFGGFTEGGSGQGRQGLEGLQVLLELGGGFGLFPSCCGVCFRHFVEGSMEPEMDFLESAASTWAIKGRSMDSK